MLDIIFCTSLFLIFYSHFGYPLLLMFLTKLRPKPVRKGENLPNVDVIITVYNEESVIKAKLENILALNYPREKLNIFVVSDGSTDNTNQYVKQYESRGVQLIAYPMRRGKISALTEAIPHLKGDVIFFSDARQMFDANALIELVRNFSDETVGAVSGELILNTDSENPASEGCGFYWRYEKWIRKLESSFGSVVGATGAIYAIRRELFTSPPKETILDDVYIPLKIVENGYRVIFEHNAKAYDKASQNFSREFGRKARTLAGNYQLLFLLPYLRNPFKNQIAWQFWSHKLLRLLAPFAFIAIFFITAIRGAVLYQALFYLQVLAYSLGAIGIVLSYFDRNFKIGTLPSTFLIMYSAAIVGLYKFITRTQKVTWDK